MVSRWFPNGRGNASSEAIARNAAGQLVIVTALAAVLTLLVRERPLAPVAAQY